MSAGGSQSSGQSASDTIGASQSGSQGFSTAMGGGTGSTSIDATQQPHLSALWDLVSGQGGSVNEMQRQTQAASDFNSQAIQGAMGNMAALANPQAQIDANTKSLTSGLSNLWSNEMLPQIAGQSIGMGGFGGGRQGVAEGVGAGQIANAFTEGLGAITTNANNTALNASNMMPLLGQFNTANAQAPAMSGFQPLAAMGSILGGPAMTSQSEQFNQSYGQDQSWMQAFNQTVARASDQSDSFEVGFGGLFG